MRIPLFGAALIAGLSGAVFAYGQVPATGIFTAKQAFPATPSIRNSLSPGGTSVQPGQSYQLVGKNKPDATFLQITVNGSRRWIDIQCGATDTQVVSSALTKASDVLALSWEPAFCSGHNDKPECQDTAAGTIGSVVKLAWAMAPAARLGILRRRPH